MSKELFVTSTPHESKVAIVEDDQLVEIYFERENEYTLAGSVYKGKVTRVLPGMQSAFVQIGLERDAFLYVTDFLEEVEETDDAVGDKPRAGGDGRESHPRDGQPRESHAREGQLQEPRSGDRGGYRESRRGGRGRGRGGRDRNHGDRPAPGGQRDQQLRQDTNRQGNERQGNERQDNKRQGNEAASGPGDAHSFPGQTLSGESFEVDFSSDDAERRNAQPAGAASGVNAGLPETAEGGAPRRWRGRRGRRRRGNGSQSAAESVETQQEGTQEEDAGFEAGPEAKSAHASQGEENLQGGHDASGRDTDEQANADDGGNHRAQQLRTEQSRPEHFHAGSAHEETPRSGSVQEVGQEQEEHHSTHPPAQGPEPPQRHESFEREASTQQLAQRPRVPAPVVLPGESLRKFNRKDEAAEPSAKTSTPSGSRSSFRPSTEVTDVAAFLAAQGETLRKHRDRPAETPRLSRTEHAEKPAADRSSAQEQTSRREAADGGDREVKAAAATDPEVWEEQSYGAPEELAHPTEEVGIDEAGKEDEAREEDELQMDSAETPQRQGASHPQPSGQEAGTRGRPGRLRRRGRRGRGGRPDRQPGVPESTKQQAGTQSTSSPQSGDASASGLIGTHQVRSESEAGHASEDQRLERGNVHGAEQSEAGGPHQFGFGALEEETVEDEVEHDFAHGAIDAEGDAGEFEELEEETLTDDMEGDVLRAGEGLAAAFAETKRAGDIEAFLEEDTADDVEDDSDEDAMEEGEFSEDVTEEETEDETEEETEDETEEETEEGIAASADGFDEEAEDDSAQNADSEDPHYATRAEHRATPATAGFQQRTQERGRDSRRGAGRNNRRRMVKGGRSRGHMGPRQPLPQIDELLKEGQEILVQIAKEPMAKKGARITSHIALPGRFLVYMPTVNHTGVSRKIGSDEERQRLKRVLLSEKGENHGGFIVRTAAAGATDDDLRADIRFLINLWNEMKQRSEDSKAPALIYHDLNLVERILRDQVTSSFSQIWVDSEQEYERILRFAQRFQPSLIKRVKLWTKDAPLFENFGLQEEINKALKSKVWLKSGGYIVINQTEALVAIDINTGKFVGKTARLEDTIVKTNIDAIKEIVRQIRLRDLGGIIVIDFIDMDERRNRQRVMQELEEALKADRSPSKVLQFNDFGLVAITRKRVKQSLERTLGTQCTYCTGTGFIKSVGTVCNEIYIELRKIAKQIEGRDITVRVNPEVAKALKANNGKWLVDMEEVAGKSVIVKNDPMLHQEQFDIQ